MTVTLPLPFRSSRELARGHLLLDAPCVVLDLAGLDLEPALYADWRRRVEQVAHALGWPQPRFACPAQAGRSLGFTAPANQLQTAREANEWALCAAVMQRDPMHWSALQEALCDVELDESRALERLRRLGRAEAQGLQSA